MLCCCSVTVINTCSMWNTQCCAVNTIANCLDAMSFKRPTVYLSLTQPHKVFGSSKHCIFCSQEGRILGRWYISLGFATGRNEFKSKLGNNQNGLQDFSSPSFLLTTGHDILQLHSLARCSSCPEISSIRQCGQFLDFLF